MNATQPPAGGPTLALRERRLVDCFLGQQMTAGDIEIFLSGQNIENCNQVELLMLSCIGYKQGWKQFPPEIVPRLKGLHQYYQVHNTIRISWLMEKIHALRAAGIPVMLLKGLALRFYYAVGTPRIMGDYDIAVPEGLYEKAVRTLQREGNSPDYTIFHHGVFEGTDRPLEVHYWIFKHYGEKDTDIWERAAPFRLCGEDVLVMCPEDMLLHQLDNRSRDMFEGTLPGRTPIFLCDCRRIMDHIGPIDLDRLAARAKELHVTHSAKRMLPLLADCFPGLLSRDEIDRVFPWTRDYQRWLEAGQKLHRVSAPWYLRRYQPQGALTPYRVVQALPRHFASYRMRKLEMEEMGRQYDFVKYCKDYGRTDSLWDLAKKLGARLRLTDKHTEG